jgi:hypothetical protein
MFSFISSLFSEKPSPIDVSKITLIPGIEKDLLLPNGRIILPSSPEYFNARLAWNWSISGTPSAIVLAKSEEDVAATIKYCITNNHQMCIAGGKHSLYCSIDNTVMLNLEEMASVVVDEKNKTATVRGIILLLMFKAELNFGCWMVPVSHLV